MNTYTFKVPTSTILVVTVQGDNIDEARDNLANWDIIDSTEDSVDFNEEDAILIDTDDEDCEE